MTREKGIGIGIRIRRYERDRKGKSSRRKGREGRKEGEKREVLGVGSWKLEVGRKGERGGGM